METQEPRKHHYIPRFILKHFQSEDNLVNYWNISNKSLQRRNIKGVFMNIDMYRDEVQSSEDPTKIEKQFGNLETKVAALMQEKLLAEKQIVLLRKEMEMLRIFMTLLSFRANHRMDQYKEGKFDSLTNEILSEYQPDGNYELLWKRQLEVLSRCESYQAIKDAQEIDPAIKLEFMNELEGYYLTFVDARGGEFIITDVYPTLEICPGVLGGNIYLHCFFPLSPTRLMILNHIMFRKELENDELLQVPRSISNIDGNMIATPKVKYKYGSSYYHDPDDVFTYSIKNVYKDQVKYVNSLFLNEARVGVMFKDEDRVIDSIVEYNALDNVKQSFEELEKAITKED